MSTESVEITILPDTANKAVVPATVEVYDSLYVDSVNTYNIDDLFYYLQSVDPTFDSSQAAVNTRIVTRLKAAEQAAAQAKAQADSLAQAQAKALNLVIDSLLNEVPTTGVDSVISWAQSVDDEVHWAVALMQYGVSRKDALMYAALYVGNDMDRVIQDASLTYAIINGQIRQRCLERGGKWEAELITKDESLQNEILALQDADCRLGERIDKVQSGVEVVYTISKNNEANLQTVTNEVNQMRKELWIQAAAIKRAKIQDKQGTDNAKMHEELKQQVDGQVKPIALTAVKLPTIESNQN